MYLITGSSTYELMKGVSESLAGRVSIIRMFQLSTREIFGCEEYVFDIHPIESIKRANDFKLDVHDLFSLIIRGMYPELHANSNLNSDSYCFDYVSSYL